MNDILVEPPRVETRSLAERITIETERRRAVAEETKQCGIEMGFLRADGTVRPIIKDSGKREEMVTGSRRDTREGKGRYDLLPARALRRLARHFEAGAGKYGDRNWEKGQPLARMMDSALRHAFEYLEGKRDEDHLIAAAWNLLCCADTEERIKEGLLPESLDDLPAPAERDTIDDEGN